MVTSWPLHSWWFSLVTFGSKDCPEEADPDLVTRISWLSPFPNTLWLRLCHRPGYLWATLQEHIHMSVIRVGSSSGYAAGWEAIFGGGRKAKAAARTKPGKAAAVKKKAVRAARPAKSAKKRAAAKKARRR
jgi:hypothetical protein